VEKRSMSLGSRVLGLGVMALALVCLAFGSFDPGQPVPRAMPDRTLLAYVAAIFMLLAGASLCWRRSVARGAMALAVYYLAVVVLLLQGPIVLRHPAEFGAYSNAAEQLAIAAAMLILFATYADIEADTTRHLTRAAQITFGFCAVLFGGAHFVYMNLTVPLVPAWLPPSRTFWAYATGVGHIAAGLAVITGVQARRAAILLTVMYASFTPLVHLPMLFAHPDSHWIWSENALNLALVGAAWVVAGSLAAPGVGRRTLTST
jgi:uncharacterized membrane protein YphA (DoxX/SURF4 family)